MIFGLAIWGSGGCIRYCEITTIAMLHFTPYSGLKQRLLLVICHWDIVSLLFRCQIPVFSHILLLKNAIFSLYLSKAFQLPIVSFLFRSSQIPDLTLPFTPNLLRSMFAYHLFLI